MTDTSNSSRDPRDAARLAVCFVEAVLSADEMTLYKVYPGSRAFERESLIDYLEELVKPIAIDAKREQEGGVLLQVTSTNPPRLGRDMEPGEPRDIGEGLSRHFRVDESALILVKGQDGADFTMRLAGLSLFDQSYRLKLGNWGYSVHKPDEAASALDAVAVLRVSRPGPEDWQYNYISLH